MTFSAVVNVLASVLALLWFAVISAVVTVTDVRWRRISNRVVLPVLVGLPVLLATPYLCALSSHDTAEMTNKLHALLCGLVGALVIFSTYLLLAVFGGLGGGDVKLASMIGLVLGYFGGWEALWVGTALAWGAAGLWILTHRAVRRGHGASKSRDPPDLPFAPFMIAGAWIVLLFV